MQRRLGFSAAACFGLEQKREYVVIKSRVENRITKPYPRKSGQEMNAERLAVEASKKHPNPQTKKESLAHLLERPKYEYVGDYQRAANDMMAIYSDHGEYSLDMSYHYQKLWKALKPSRIGAEEGSNFEPVRVAPGNQQL